MSDAPLVRSSESDGVRTITLDSHSNRNALSRRLLAELDGAITAAQHDAATRVIVLTAVGNVFCSGADLAEQQQGVAAPPAEFADLLRKVWSSPQPVIARVNGSVRGGGIGLIAASDIAIGLRRATFAFGEVRLGAVAAVVAVPCLQRMTSRDAAELFLTGVTFDGEKAASTRLLTVAVEDDDLDRSVDQYLADLRAGGPGALRLTKELLRTVPNLSIDDAFARMAQLSADRWSSAEAREGSTAFVEKRAPQWMQSRAK